MKSLILCRYLLCLCIVCAACASRATVPTLVTYYFTGLVTQERSSVSVFNEPVGSTFSGSFSYNPAATAFYPNYFPLVSFNLDGHNLDVSNGTSIPFVPGVLLSPSLPPGAGFSMIEIRGFFLPAAQADPTDNGSTSLVFQDFVGNAITNSALPTSLSLSEFTDSIVVGPVFVSSPAPASNDRGNITLLSPTPVPEPAATLLLPLALGCLLARRVGKFK